MDDGDEFNIQNSNLSGRITGQFGAGGQGQVFKAQMSDGTTKAVKIYHQQYLQENGWLKQKIPALVHKGSPGDRFLWPEGIVEVKKDRSLFGYVMPLKPSEYKDAVNFLVEPLSYRKLLRACTQISKSFEKLHSLGLCYRDINYNNVCINPETGDSLIIDNDNVDFDSDECQIAIGFPSFIAPEVLNGSRPSSDSDRHSLAVLYYYLFFKAHPLDGKAVLQYDIWGADDQNAHYKSAVYHFHPEDKSNEALEISEDDEEGFAGHRAIVFRKRFPDNFLAHFDKTFVQGLKKKYMRTIESVWRGAFDTLGHQIIHCRNSTCMDPQTGPRENFYRGEFSQKCYHCNSELAMPPRMKVMPDNKVIVLTHDIKLRGRHIGSSRNRQEQDQVLAEINVHPERNIWGLKNNSNTNWSIQFERDGDQVPVEHGKRFSLDKPKILVDFKNGRKGIIRCGGASRSETNSATPTSGST